MPATASSTLTALSSARRNSGRHGQLWSVNLVFVMFFVSFHNKWDSMKQEIYIYICIIYIRYPKDPDMYGKWPSLGHPFPIFFSRHAGSIRRSLLRIIKGPKKVSNDKVFLSSSFGLAAYTPPQTVERTATKLKDVWKKQGQALHRPEKASGNLQRSGYVYMPWYSCGSAQAIQLASIFRPPVQVHSYASRVSGICQNSL